MVGPSEHFNQDIFLKDEEGIKLKFDLPEDPYSPDTIMAMISDSNNIHGDEPKMLPYQPQNPAVSGSRLVAPLYGLEYFQVDVESSAPSTEQATRKKKTTFNFMQQQALAQEFATREHNPYLSAGEESHIAEYLNLEPEQVRKWFANKRYRQKRRSH